MAGSNIYVVMIITLIVFGGIFLYMIFLDLRLNYINTLLYNTMFVSGNLRAKWAIFFLSIDIIVSIIAFGSEITNFRVIYLSRFIITIIEIVTSIFAGIAFLIWMYRVHLNLLSLNVRHLKYYPGDAVSSFFIPFVNLYRPFQIMKEIWRASDPNVELTNEYAWSKVIVSPVVSWWWFIIIINIINNSILLRVHIVGATSFSYLAYILTAILTIFLINSINKKQEEKHNLLAVKIYSDTNP